jgi:protein-S-isoprenylcysteine O-methyltransferase Ste14
MIMMARGERFLDRNFPDQYSSYETAVRRGF